MKNYLLKNRRMYFSAAIAVIFIIYFFLLPEFTEARAGGGGRGSCNSIWCILMYPFIIIGSLIVSWIASRKMKLASKILAKISKKDSVWDENFIESRASNAFYKIQEAWTERDPDIGKDFMTDRLYNKHSAQISSMIENKEINILKDIDLEKSEVVEIKDFKDDSRDRVGVYMTGSMIDYMVKEDNRDIIIDKSGEKFREPRHFRELWYFNRVGNNWYADEIDSHVSIKDITGVKNIVE